jgi:O-antigen ligase
MDTREKVGLAVSGVAVLVLAYAASFAGARESTILLDLLVATLALIAIYVASPGVPVLLALPVWLILFGSLLPRDVELLGEAALVALACAWTLRNFTLRVRGAYAGALCLVVAVYWVALSFNANVPSFSLSLVGVRKSVLVFVAVAVGLGLPRRYSTERAIVFVTRVLLAGGILCLVAHFAVPSIEDRIVRAADQYTGEFAGQARLQGIFSGPFHVALLGIFLAADAWRRTLFSRASSLPQRLEVGAMGAVGLASIYFAQVRSAYLCVGVIFVVTTVWAARRSRHKARIIGITVVVSVTMLALVIGLADPASRSLSGLLSDQRALGREDTWQAGADLVLTSPIYGWGPGSAGDTLGDEFNGAEHVTAHDAALGLAVEGGLIGLGLAAASLGVVAWMLLRSKSGMGAAHVALLALLLMSVTDSISSAVPVSLFLAIIVGLGAQAACRLREEPEEPQPELDAAEVPVPARAGVD